MTIRSSFLIIANVSNTYLFTFIATMLDTRVRTSAETEKQRISGTCSCLERHLTAKMFTSEWANSSSSGWTGSSTWIYPDLFDIPCFV